MLGVCSHRAVTHSTALAAGWRLQQRRVENTAQRDSRLVLLYPHSRAQELCESRGGRPGFTVRNSPCGLCGRKSTLNLNDCLEELRRSCVKNEVDVLDSPSLIVRTVSVDLVRVQCRFTSTETRQTIGDGEPRTATSTFTQLLSSAVGVKQH